MTTTEQEKQALSQAVADKYGIEAISFYQPPNHEIGYFVDLADDWARLMPLAVEQGISIYIDDVDNKYVVADWTREHGATETFKNHPTKEEAVRIAICRALIEKEI